MKKEIFLETICSFIILMIVLAFSTFSQAQTPKPFTTLEQKLYEASKKEGQVEWWDEHSLTEATAYINAFEARYPGVKVIFWGAQEDTRNEKYFMDHQSGRHTLDIHSTNQYLRYKKEGLLTDLSDLIEDVGYPKDYHTSDSLGTAIEFTLYGGAYNAKRVQPNDVPRSWEDLLDPKWKGKIAMDRRMKLFIFFTEYWGEEKVVDYLKKLKEQKPIFSKGGTLMATMLGAGEFPIALDVLLHRIIIMQRKGSPVTWMPINPIVLRPVQPNVVLRHAPHPNAAKLFLRYWMSNEGQALVDKIRIKGNPLPGTGTAPSKVVEKLGLKIHSASEWTLANMNRLEKLYQVAIGYKQ
ncbi:MAG: extracellular solute-binding protein [Deltaproteobacteria bacterium]|nr:extracellular solute-binding protein [Deltaproteobacteria bacterium]